MIQQRQNSPHCMRHGEAARGLNLSPSPSSHYGELGLEPAKLLMQVQTAPYWEIRPRNWVGTVAVATTVSYDPKSASSPSLHLPPFCSALTCPVTGEPLSLMGEGLRLVPAGQVFQLAPESPMLSQYALQHVWAGARPHPFGSSRLRIEP